MSGTCPTCGLPDELCVCDDMAKTDAEVTVTVTERRYGKEVTIVKDFHQDADLEALASKLKSELACGGTVKDGHIELQGNHTDRVEPVLNDENIAVM